VGRVADAAEVVVGDARMRRTLALTVGIAAFAAVAAAPASGSVATQSNTTPFDCPLSPVALGDCDPNPSTITVAGEDGIVTDVNVFINGISAAFSDDVEVLLVSPQGQAIQLWDDAGGNNAISNLNVSFNDQAAGPMADAAAPVSQGYKPSSYDMPGLENQINTGSPPAPYGLTLSLVNGISPNGTWSLYLGDDANGMQAVTETGGWMISITSTDVPPAANTPPVTTPTTPTTPATTPTPAKKCKKGQKRKRGKCVKRKKKK
jgi:hypothetical protein